MRFITEDRGAPKSAGPVGIAEFATIVNPAMITLSWKYMFLVMTVYYLLGNKIPRYNATHF